MNRLDENNKVYLQISRFPQLHWVKPVYFFNHSTLRGSYSLWLEEFPYKTPGWWKEYSCVRPQLGGLISNLAVVEQEVMRWWRCYCFRNIFLTRPHAHVLHQKVPATLWASSCPLRLRLHGCIVKNLLCPSHCQSNSVSHCYCCTTCLWRLLLVFIATHCGNLFKS